MAFLHDCEANGQFLTEDLPQNFQQSPYDFVQPRTGYFAVQIGIRRHALCRLVLLILLAIATHLSAQTASPATTSPSTPGNTHAQHHIVHHHKRHHGRAKVTEPVVVAPAAPPPPVPPAQQPSNPARIMFHPGSQQRPGSLEIVANNSSLIDILNQVSHQTGMAVEGLNHDERIYGRYGPGPVSATLTQLLDGAGYDYIIVGGGPGKSPAKLQLTTASNTPASTAPIGATYTPPPATTAPANPSEPTHPKTPQEIFNELRHMHPPQ
jgi:hypothetical protein